MYRCKLLGLLKNSFSLLCELVINQLGNWLEFSLSPTNTQTVKHIDITQELAQNRVVMFASNIRYLTAFYPKCLPSIKHFSQTHKRVIAFLM